MPDRLGRISVGLREQVGAQPQAHVVVGRKLSQISGQQHVPALAGGPLENRQEVEPGLVGQRVDRVPGRIEELRIHRTGNHHQFRALHATGCEGLDIELRRHPDLIHPIAGGNPIGCDAIGLEHRATDAVVGVGEADEAAGRIVRNDNAAAHSFKPVAHPEQGLPISGSQTAGEAFGIDGGLMVDSQGAAIF